jgi:Xaa-Pro dipeptidase
MDPRLDSLFPAHLAQVRTRTDAALQASGHDGVVMFSGRAPYRFLDDNAYPFTANPHFLHWAPLLNAPDSFIRYVPGQRPQLLFHQPADYWYQPPAWPTDAWTREFDIEVIREPGEARALLAADAGRFALIGDSPPEFAGWGFAATNPPRLLDPLHFHRAIKTPYEIECMRRASALGARGHRAAEDAYRAGASEYEVHQAYCSATGLREQELPYGNIVAFGRGAAVLHYQNLVRRRDAPRPSFLIDAGAAYRGYASDITRTHGGGDASFGELIAGMDALQQRLCSAVRAGTDYREVHLQAHWLIAGLLRDAQIITCSQETAVAEAVTGVFFPHGIGHLLGLQVHDVAGFARDAAGGDIPKPAGHPYLRLTRTLQPGFVVTIEPGLYFIDLLLERARAGTAGRHIRWDTVERLAPFGGIRIEDNVLCTDGEPENLTRDAFAALA